MLWLLMLLLRNRPTIRGIILQQRLLTSNVDGRGKGRRERKGEWEHESPMISSNIESPNASLYKHKVVLCIDSWWAALCTSITRPLKL